MKTQTLNSTCICGTKLEVKVNKPTRMQYTVGRAKCPGCQSHYILSCSVVNGKQGREYKIEIEAIEITDKAKFIAKTRIAEQEPPSPAA